MFKLIVQPLVSFSLNLRIGQRIQNVIITNIGCVIVIYFENFSQIFTSNTFQKCNFYLSLTVDLALADTNVPVPFNRLCCFSCLTMTQTAHKVAATFRKL
uniref:Uncharacterized protein n=1 Tax=Cacopsylla melanoneura TaxID=428564 RepID=A0A8D8QNT7_9HEMI